MSIPLTTFIKHHRNSIREFLLIFLIAMVCLLAIGVAHYLTHEEMERLAQESDERLNVALGQGAITRNLHGVISDLLYLAEHNEYQGLFDGESALQKTKLALEFQVFSKHKQIYDQLRLLNEHGHEVIRVNYNDGDPVIIPKDALQDKSGRYYYSRTLALERGQVFISPLDLNIERGQIEQPIKPMLRLGTPIFDSAGNNKGMLLLNYLGDTLLEDFTRATANIDDHVMLLNSDGFWLSSAEAEQEWGFMYGKDNNFAKHQPEAWQQILLHVSGQFYTSEGLFSYATVYPLSAASANPEDRAHQLPDEQASSHYWKVVSHLPPPGSGFVSWMDQHLPLYTFMLLMLGTGSAFLAHTRISHQQAKIQVEFERRFRAILENVDLLAVVVDAHGRINFCNDALLDLTGGDRQSIMHRDWFEIFIAAENRKQCRQAFKHTLLQKEKPIHHECEIQTQDGGIRLVSWNVSRMLDANEKVIGVTHIGEDITEARQADEQLRKLSRAVEQSPSTVMIVDTEGQIEYVNPKFTDLTGYTLDEVKGKNPSILKSGETSSDEYTELWETISTGDEWRGVFHNRKKSGELYWEAACISGIRDSEGVITHYLAVKEDITERRRLEQEVEERNRVIAHNQALAATGQMASMIAHDLRNPLSSIKMGLQILGKRSGKEWQLQENELRKIALQQVGYMEEILEDLLSYSRPEALKPEWLNIDKLLDTAILLAQRQIEEHGVKVRTWYQTGLPTLHGDQGKLRQVFCNMIINAAQATAGVKDNSPEISITARMELADDHPRIRVEICDNGCGIKAGDEAQMFEPFFTTRAKGTGLGLAIVKRIVDQHHGTVRLKSGESGGACAVVILPTGPLQAEMGDLQQDKDKQATG